MKHRATRSTAPRSTAPRSAGRAAPALALSLVLSAPLAAQSAGITQIDSSLLMPLQLNRIYAHILDERGRVLQEADPASLRVYESADGLAYVEAGKPRIVRSANIDQGISFLFLLDNSGSMYEGLDGAPAKDPAATRATAVKRAASEFLLSITSSKDSVGIAAFNTRYALLKAPARDLSETAKAMDRLAKPADDQGYTELYASLVLASRDLGALRGRKALVVLSDGRNFPYFEKSGKASPAFGTKAFAAEESLDEAIRQGVTIFAVNFGPDKDSRLAELALRSGGEVFDARDSAELANIYASIRGKILTEILVEYKASMFSGDKRWVKLAYGPKGPGGEETARYYYSGTVFGRSFAGLSLWFLILVPLALLGLYGISLLRFEKPSVSANLSLLYAPGIGKGTKMFAVGERTVIGSDETADITITGNSRLQASPVTIVKDPTTGRFTIQSGESLTVNNRSVAKKTLEPGDVINFNGTIAVFDDADMTTLRKTKKSDPKVKGKK